MKAKKKKVQVECWDCGIEKHRHRSERVANECIEKQKTTRVLPTEEEYKRRNLKAVELWLKGATCKIAAESIGVTAARFRKILWHIIRVSRSHSIDLPAEPQDGFFRTGVKPEYREHYLERVKAVAKYWGIEDFVESKGE